MPTFTELNEAIVLTGVKIIICCTVLGITSLNWIKFKRG